MIAKIHRPEVVMPTMQPHPGPWWQRPFGYFVRRRNKAIVRRVLAAFNTGDTRAIDEVEAPDYVDHIPFPPGYRGPAGIKRQIHDLHEAFGELSFVETACIAEGDIVVIRHRMTGIHRAPFLGAPPTNQWISYPAQDINRIRKGKIVEHLGSVDILEFLDALGVLSADLLEHPKLQRLRRYVAGQLVSPSGQPGVEAVYGPRDLTRTPSRAPSDAEQGEVSARRGA